MMEMGNGFSAPGTDLEIRQGVRHPDPQQQRNAIALEDALLSECATACEKLVAEDEGFVRRLDEAAVQMCSDAGKACQELGCPRHRSTACFQAAERDATKRSKTHLIVRAVVPCPVNV